jgi:hypothetical protein
MTTREARSQPGYLNHRSRQQDPRYKAAVPLFWTSLAPGWKKRYHPDAHTFATLEFFVKLVLPFTPEETGYTPGEQRDVLKNFFSERHIAGPEQVFLRESVGYLLRSVKAQVKQDG